MKKIIIFGLVTLLLIGIATGAIFNTKELAEAFKIQQVQARDTAVSQALPTITYTDDVKCIYTALDQEEPTCLAYFQYTYNGEIYNRRTVVTEDMTTTQIDDEVKLHVKEEIKRTFEQPVEYSSTKLKDRRITAIALP